MNACRRSRLSDHFDFELTAYLARQPVIDLAMPGYRGVLAIRGVEIN